MPPGFKLFMQSPTILFCRVLQRLTLSRLHSFTASGCFLKSPEPLQGTSATITSNTASNFAKICGSQLLTAVLQVPHLFKLCTNISARDLITSLLIKKLSSLSKLLINVDFPPGAAHRSNTANG